MAAENSKKTAHQGLWERLLKLDPAETAKRAKCKYLGERHLYLVTLLNNEYVVDLRNKRIYFAKPDSGSASAEFIEQLCILAYLIGAKDLPPKEKLVKAEDLPAGQFFFRGRHNLPVAELEKAFGECPKRLYQAAEQLGQEQCEFGDASIRFYALPRIPLTIIIWGRDDEFGARASILFDQTAADHLMLDALLALARLAVDRLTGRCCGRE